MELGVSLKAKPVRVIDADTIEVEVTRRFNVRVRNVDAPERNTPEGQEAKRFVEFIIGTADIVLFIPTNDQIHLMDFNSFNRVVADIYLHETKLADLLKNAGHIKTK